jgi:hypothetical protein
MRACVRAAADSMVRRDAVRAKAASMAAAGMQKDLCEGASRPACQHGALAVCQGRTQRKFCRAQEGAGLASVKGARPRARFFRAATQANRQVGGRRLRSAAEVPAPHAPRLINQGEVHTFCLGSVAASVAAESKKRRLSCLLASSSRPHSGILACDKVAKQNPRHEAGRPSKAAPDGRTISVLDTSRAAQHAALLAANGHSAAAIAAGRE